MRLILLTLLLISNTSMSQQIFRDLTVQDFKVVSTVKGSTPCPLMTQAQRDAISSPTNGKCVYNTTTSKLNTYNGTIWKASGGGVDNWVTATSYAINDLVIQSSKIYQCQTAHTSATFSTDLAAVKWVEISQGVTDHASLTSIGTNTHTQIDTALTRLAATSGTNTGDQTNIAGNAATVTTNANLSGVITSSGNTTSISSQTGTGSKFVVDTSPTLVTPNVGVANGTSLVLGGTINANAILDAQSTTKAFMPPRMTATQKNAISSPTAGMQVFDTTLNSMSYYDGTAWGFGVGNLLLDTVYTATISTSGVVSNQNKSFINGNCTGTAPYTCTFISGIFTSAPNCTYSNGSSSARLTYLTDTMSSTTLAFYAQNDSNTNTTATTVINCQKSGVDYTNSSSSVFTGASANTDWVACTFSTLAWQGLGTVTNTSLQCRRSGGMLEMKGSVALGTVSANAIQIPLPNNYGTITTSSSSVNDSYGLIVRLTAASDIVQNAIATVGLGYFQVSASLISSTNAPQSVANGNTVYGSGNTIVFQNIRIPISGWSNLSQVVANISGYTQVPGVAGSANPNIDTFSFNFGTTNAITVCSASPCSYLDQIGTAVSSVTRSGTGLYTMNTAATYLKLKCKEDWAISSAGDATGNLEGFKSSAVSEMGCTNCNSLAFRLINYNATAVVDGFLGITCIGTR